LDASKIIGFDYKYNDEESTLTIELDTSKWDFRLKKEVLFSYDLNVDDTVSTTLLPNTSYDIYYNGNNFAILDGSSSYYPDFLLQNIDNSTTATYTTYSLSCVNNNNTQTLFLDYGDSSSSPLVNEGSISINSYNVLYTQENNVSNICTVSSGTKVGTINFELCANNLPSSITPTTLTESSTTNVTISGLNVYNYYTFFVKIPAVGGSNVEFNFILMNTVENTTDYSYAMIGNFYNKDSEECACQFLTGSNTNYYIVNRNKKYRAFENGDGQRLMTFSGYSYSSSSGNGTLKIKIGDYTSIVGPSDVLCS
jgi:hypothetical protein